MEAWDDLHLSVTYRDDIKYFFPTDNNCDGRVTRDVIINIYIEELWNPFKAHRSPGLTCGQNIMQNVLLMSTGARTLVHFGTVYDVRNNIWAVLRRRVNTYILSVFESYSKLETQRDQMLRNGAITMLRVQPYAWSLRLLIFLFHHLRCLASTSLHLVSFVF